MQGAAPPEHVDRARQRQVVAAFLAALREGNFDGLLALLHPDVLLRDDSASLPPGAASLMRGAHDVAVHALTYSRSARFVRPAVVDGTPGLAIAPMRRIIGALGFTVTDGRITEIQLISARARLRHVELSRAGPGWQDGET